MNEVQHQKGGPINQCSQKISHSFIQKPRPSHKHNGRLDLNTWRSSQLHVISQDQGISSWGCRLPSDFDAIFTVSKFYFKLLACFFPTADLRYPLCRSTRISVLYLVTSKAIDMITSTQTSNNELKRYEVLRNSYHRKELIILFHSPLSTCLRSSSTLTTSCSIIPQYGETIIVILLNWYSIKPTAKDL